MGDSIINIDPQHFLHEPARGKSHFTVIPVSQQNVSDQDEICAKLLQKLAVAATVEDQLICFKEVSGVLLRNHLDDEVTWSTRLNCLNIAIELYFSAPLKHPLKKSITKILNLLRDDLVSSCEDILCNSLKMCMKASISSKSIYDLNTAVGTLLNSLECLCLGPAAVNNSLPDVLFFLEDVLLLCSGSIRKYSSSIIKIEVVKLAHSSFRTVFLLLQKLPVFKNIDKREKLEIQNLYGIQKIANQFMNNSDIPLDTRSICGLVIILLEDLREETEGWIQLLDINNLKPTKSVDVSDQVSSVCVCLGMLSGLRLEQLQYIHSTLNKTVVSCIFDIALNLNSKGTQESFVILGVWRLMLQLTRTLAMHPVLVSSLTVQQFEQLVNPLWSHLDHYMDTVKHLSRAVLENLVQLKEALLLLGFDICEKMKDAVLLLPNTKRGPFVILNVMANCMGADEVIHLLPNLVPMLLTSMQCSSASSYASSAFTSILTSHIKVIPQMKWIKTWVMPLLKVMMNHQVDNVIILEDVLARILQLCPDVLDEILILAKWTDNHCMSNIRTLLTCLKISRRLGLLDNIKREEGEEKLWHSIVPVSYLYSALIHQSDELRLSSLSLVVETNKSTEVILSEDCDLVQYFLEYNINCDIAAIRQQTLALIFKFLARMKESSYCLERSIQLKKEEDSCPHTYKHFLSWLISFCFKNLTMGSNFSRRISSLKLLSYLFDTFKMKHVMDKNEWESLVFTEDNGQNLLHIILMDTFEDNKEIATSLLISFPSDTFGLISNENLRGLFQSGIKMASSSHPSYCVSSAYILELCVNVMSQTQQASSKNVDFIAKENSLLQSILTIKVELMRHLECAERSLLEAACNGPMYGCLFCIRHLFRLIPDLRQLKQKDSWRNLISDVIDLSLKISHTVSVVVNNSSPEGHLPMDFNDGKLSLERDHNSVSSPFKATAQMVLLCSWRTVKEVSLLLGELSDRCPILPDEDGILSEDQLLSIGDHLTTLLEETKHRGAFEQAYVGFSLLVSRLWRHPKESLHALPQQWLHELLNAIQSVQPMKSKLCATRRSAGVPFLVQALVTAELQTGSGAVTLQKTMKQLLHFAADKENHVECRTHALNILRALFRHSPLAEHVTPFISEGYIVAISGFRGMTWAERNSATLLFSSLMTRVFGVSRSREVINQRNKMTGQMFFQRYPQLYPYLLTELEQAVQALHTDNPTELASLYPVLLLLTRLYPSSLEGTNSVMQLSMFVPSVQKCAGSSVFKTRIAAAKALVPLIPSSSFCAHVDKVIQAIGIAEQENLRHGLLLQVVQLLKNTLILSDSQLTEFCNSLGKWISGLLVQFSKSSCFTVLEIFFQVCEIVAENWYLLVPSSVWSSMEKLLELVLKLKNRKDLCSKVLIGCSVLEARSSRFFLHLLVLRKYKDLDLIVNGLLDHESSEVVQETLLFIEQILSNSNLFQIDEEEESILPNALEEEEFWVKRLPCECVSSAFTILHESKTLGIKLASMVNCEYNLQSRLTLRALIHIASLTWYQHMDVQVLVQNCTSAHEANCCAALSCFSSFLAISSEKADMFYWLESGCKEVPRFCSEERSVSCRTAALNFLLQHKPALKHQYTFLKDETVCELWVAAIKLASDEDLQVREKAAYLVSNVPSVPKVVQESLLKEFVSVMEYTPVCKATLIALGLGTVPDSLSIEDVDERVFDKGEMNLFHEQEIFTEMVCKHLSDFPKQTVLTSAQICWIYSMVCGSVCVDKDNMTEQEFFKTLQCTASNESKQYADYLVPPSIASFVHRVTLVEVASCNIPEMKTYKSSPYSFRKLMEI